MDTATKIGTAFQIGLMLVAIIIVIGKVVFGSISSIREYGLKKCLKVAISIAAACYVVYAIKSVVDNSTASLLHQCVAGLALLAWLWWTIHTIDEKRRERESTALCFRYSRVTDGFPEEFEKFCEQHHIGATDEFARDAIQKEMHRIDNAKKKAAGEE